MKLQEALPIQGSAKEGIKMESILLFLFRQRPPYFCLMDRNMLATLGILIRRSRKL